VTDYVTVERAGNEAFADLIRQRLEEAGIPCVLVPDSTAAVTGASASFAVTVPPDRADEARELLGD
jgi:Putative prokaryotic signal transducing protein